MQLLECCSEPLRKDLTRAAGGTLTNKTEAQVLAAIKTLAVREENKNGDTHEATRTEFQAPSRSNICQKDPEEDMS